MVEVVGAIASVLNMSQAIAEGLGQIVDLYEAPAEIEALQEQVNIFDSLLRRVEATTQGHTNDDLNTAISKARDVVTDLHSLISEKLISHGDGRRRVRRTVWLRNRRKIAKLCSRLKDARETVSAAIHAETWSSMHQIASNLTILCPQSASFQSTSTESIHGLERRKRAGTSQQLAGEGNKLVFRATVRQQGRDKPKMADVLSTTQDSMPALSLLAQSSRCGDFKTTRMSPCGFLEAGPSWRPGAYTSSNVVPALFSYLRFAANANEYTRVNQYSLFYYREPGRWTRLTLSIATTVESKYHGTNKLGIVATGKLVKITHEAPDEIVSALGPFLRRRPNVEPDSHISLFLGKSSSLQEPEMEARLFKPSFPVSRYLREITGWIYHVECPWFYDKTLDSRPLYNGKPNDFFTAFLDNRWVLLVRFGSERRRIDFQLYHLKLMLHLRGSRRLSPFVGVVRDDETGVVSGFLCELPAKGSLFTVVGRASRAGHPICQQRRLKWCKQIVEGVAELHDKEFVAGTLCDSPTCAVFIDGHDNAVLFHRLQKFTSYDAHGIGILPPEYWKSVPDEYSALVQPQDEIYQLGFLLWRVYANLSMGKASAELYNHVCGTQNDGTVYHGRQPEEIPLPPLDEHAPQYLRDVIAACRAERPEDRLPAWKLLKLFPLTPEASEHSAANPYTCDSSCPSDEGRRVDDVRPARSASGEVAPTRSTCRITRLEECFDIFEFAISCDRCGDWASEQAFKCAVCNSGDFDLCHACFLMGFHCHDLDHQLREHSRNGNKKTYYTSPNEDGQRDVIML